LRLYDFDSSRLAGFAADWDPRRHAGFDTDGGARDCHAGVADACTGRRYGHAGVGSRDPLADFRSRNTHANIGPGYARAVCAAADTFAGRKADTVAYT
jgi:hypothetical protein